MIKEKHIMYGFDDGKYVDFIKCNEYKVKVIIEFMDKTDNILKKEIIVVKRIGTIITKYNVSFDNTVFYSFQRYYQVFLNNGIYEPLCDDDDEGIKTSNLKEYFIKYYKNIGGIELISIKLNVDI